MDRIKIDDGREYGTIAAVLREVFHKTNQKGEPVKLFLKGGCEIQRNKGAAFFCLAERGEKGGWRSPRKANNWLNIPDPDGKAFTQIQLNKTDDSFFAAGRPSREIAVFMHVKNRSGKYVYRFYGIFERHDVNRATGICVFRRLQTTLKCAEWLAAPAQGSAETPPANAPKHGSKPAAPVRKRRTALG